MVTLDPAAQALIMPAARFRPFCPDEYDTDALELIKAPEEVDSCDVGLLGAPFDTACLSRRGSKWGPQAVRQSLIMWSHYNLDTGVDLTGDFSIVDFGDVDVVHTDILETHRRVEEVLTAIYDTGAVPILIGGDHSLAYPGMKALANVVEGKIGVIGFDSHLDVRPSRHGEASSGMPFRQALEETDGKVVHVAEIGINGWHNAKRYHDYTKEMGIKVVTALEVHKRGPDVVAEEVLDFASDGVDALYVTLDVDALDVGVVPGTCIPSPGGLLAWEALELVHAFSSHPLTRGMDHVEVSPALDTNNAITATTGSALLMQMIGGARQRKDRADVRELHGVTAVR
jgi:formimidoylglutamase